MRYLMRLNAEKGTASKADVKGYYVGGKTGTAEKVVGGRYSKTKAAHHLHGGAAGRQAALSVADHARRAAGRSPETHGFATSGWNAVPVGGNVIARIAPLLGLEPRFELAAGRQADPRQRQADSRELTLTLAGQCVAHLCHSVDARNAVDDMKLANLLTADAVSDARFAALEVDGISADSRTVKPGDLFVAMPGTKADGLRFVGAGAGGGRGRRDGGARAADAAAGGRRLRAGRRCAPRAGARRGELLSAPAARRSPRSPAPAARPRSPPSRARSGQRSASRRRASAPSASSRPTREVYGSLTTPDPVALHRSLDELAGEGVTHLAMEASSHGLDQHRLDGVRDRGRRLHQSQPRPSRLSPDARGLSRRQAAAVRATCSQPGGAAVIDADHEHADAVIGGGQAARGCGCSRSAARGEGIRLHRRDDRRLRADAARSRYGGDDYTVRLPLVGAFQVENALVAAGLAIATGSEPRRGVRRARSARRRQGPARARRRDATARRSSSTMPTSPTRSPRRSMRCGPMRPAGSSWCSAAAATATPASGR